jgi:hypothetical protein
VLTGAAAVWHNRPTARTTKYLASSNVDEIPGLYDRTIDCDRRDHVLHRGTGLHDHRRAPPPYRRSQ